MEFGFGLLPIATVDSFIIAPNVQINLHVVGAILWCRIPIAIYHLFLALGVVIVALMMVLVLNGIGFLPSALQQIHVIPTPIAQSALSNQHVDGLHMYQTMETLLDFANLDLRMVQTLLCQELL